MIFIENTTQCFFFVGLNSSLRGQSRFFARGTLASGFSELVSGRQQMIGGLTKSTGV